MSEDSLARKRVVYETPETEAVRGETGIDFRSSRDTTLAMDLYRPAQSERERDSLPAVVLIGGYPDPGYERMLGCKCKDTGASTSWARLIASSGMAAITYTNEEPQADARALLDFVRERSGALGVDGSRVGLFATSGNVPLALSLALDHGPGIVCAALYYGFFPDDASSAPLAAAAAKWRFTNPFDGVALESLRRDVPLLLGRGGRDEMPDVNTTLDRFATTALAQNLPITLVNHPDGPHAFDLFHDSELTRAVIRQTLGFLQAHLRAGRSPAEG